MSTNTTAKFHIYRYQILPQDRFHQGDLYGYAGVGDVIREKNNIFRDALDAPFAVKGGRSDLLVKKLFKDDDFFLFQIAVNRSLNRETEDFRTETLDNWPKIWVAIWNNPERQLIAVQCRNKAFQDTDVVVKIIFDSVDAALRKTNLIAIWETLFERQKFWDLVFRHEGKIKEIDFEIITPNMANISKVLPEELKSFAKTTNAVKSHVAIRLY